MAPKMLSECTLEEIENYITNFLDKFESYTKIPNQRANHSKCLIHSANIKVILKSKRACIEDTHKELLGILLYMTEFYPEKVLIKAKDFTKSAIDGIEEKIDIFKYVHEKHEQIKNIQLSNKIIRNKPITDAGDMEAALQLHVRETQDMQYPLKKIASQFTANSDLEEMLSVNQKVSKWEGYVTDVTAIRDCVSHSAYEINESKVIFDNHKKGYDYHQEFTFKEFQDFMGFKGQLYALFFDLIDLLYIENLLKIFFSKCDKNFKDC